MKKAIVIGASSGIGQEVARLLIEDGWTLGVAARREERLMPLKQLAEDRVEVARLDVMEDSATQVLQQLI